MSDIDQITSRILAAVGKSVVGQEQLLRALILSLISEGHVLLEGVPGLAKTLSIKSLATAIDASFQRIQFTPDLLPADVLGTEVFRDGAFEVRKGPIFAHFVLADEINRAPAKVQSALLETMQEQQVTIGAESFRVPTPFFVMATQNPVEQEGTYPLPEAQIDRFFMKVKVDYPTPEEELQILDVATRDERKSEPLTAVASLEDIERLREGAREIHVDERVRRYMVDLVWASREPQRFQLKLDRLIELGASPRASISLFLAARAEALLCGENFVSPQNVKDVALNVLRHRVTPSYEAEAQGMTSDSIVQDILNGVQVP